MKTFLLGVVGVGAAISMVSWTEKVDIQRDNGALAYEQCVAAEYGMVPIKYYEEYNKYPTCGK